MPEAPSNTPRAEGPQPERPRADTLRIDGVWKTYQRAKITTTVLENATLSVPAGTVGAVVGTRAQGKSTLIRIASGTLPPDCGTVHLNGRDLTTLNDADYSAVLANELGVALSSGPRVRLDVHAYVEMSLAATKRWNGRQRRQRVSHVLKDLGVTSCAKMKWKELSQWQQVLVELAQAVVVTPRLLLVDDLVDGLNLGKKQAVMEILRSIAQSTGCAVLTAVSDHEAALQSDQVWQLRDGRLKLMHSGPDIVNLALHRERSPAHALDA